MIKRVDRYVGGSAVLGVLFVWISMTLLLMMFTLLGQLRDSTAGYGTSDVMWYVLQTGPRSAYDVFPISALLGSLLGIGGLASANELVAFRTSGVSRLRLAAAGLAGVLLLTLPVMAIGEWIVPGLEQRASAFRISQLAGQLIIGGPNGMWMRDGDEIVNIRRPLMTVGRSGQSISFQNIEIYAFDQAENLRQVTRAKRALFGDGRWTLEGVSEVDIGPDRVTTVRRAQRPWHTTVKPGLLASAVTRPDYLSLRVLKNQLGYLKRNGLNDALYRTAFWEKIVYPLTVIALVLAGMPLVFGAARFMKLGMRLFVGMTLGGVFLLVNGTAQNLAAAYSLPIVLSTLAPSFLLALFAVMMLRRSI